MADNEAAPFPIAAFIVSHHYARSDGSLPPAGGPPALSLGGGGLRSIYCRVPSADPTVYTVSAGLSDRAGPPTPAIRLPLAAPGPAPRGLTARTAPLLARTCTCSAECRFWAFISIGGSGWGCF